jgi:hypothetical protein
VHAHHTIFGGPAPPNTLALDNRFLSLVVRLSSSPLLAKSLDAILYFLQEAVLHTNDLSTDLLLEILTSLAATCPVPSARLVALQLITSIVVDKLQGTDQYVALKDLCEHENMAMRGEAYRNLRDVLLRGSSASCAPTEKTGLIAITGTGDQGTAVVDHHL